jgi:hypothetical protein
MNWTNAGSFCVQNRELEVSKRTYKVLRIL